MRDFEERRAEIFRRSEERISQRRRRRKIIVSCIPLVVLIAAVSVMKFSFFDLEKSGSIDGEFKPENNISADSSAAGTSNGTGNYVAVKVVGSGENAKYSKVINDRETVDKIVCAIRTMEKPDSDASGGENKNSNDQNADPPMDAAVASPSEGEKGKAGFTVVAVRDDGAEEVYTISGDDLEGANQSGNAILHEIIYYICD